MDFVEIKLTFSSNSTELSNFEGFFGSLIVLGKNNENIKPITQKLAATKNTK